MERGQFLERKTLSCIDPQVMVARRNTGIAKARLGSWEKVRVWYGNGHSAAAYQRLARDPGFRPSVDLVHRVNGMSLPSELKLAHCCDSCGEVHAAGDCHGKPVVSVVIRRSKYHGTSPFTPEHRRRKAAIGATWQEVIEAGLIALEDNQTQGVQAAK